jgi:DNA (cytosine-5)-methyltransferase 1
VGKREGINKNTRSGLLYEVERLLEVSKLNNSLPQYLLLENVKNLVGKMFKGQFEDWIKYLDYMGYNTYWQVLNAKDYGVPQNRERVFAVSIRKDIDKNEYKFPEKQELGLRIKDIKFIHTFNNN